MLHIGVDLHKRRAQVPVVNDAGRVVSNCAVACDGDSMEGFFARLPQPAEVAAARKLLKAIRYMLKEGQNFSEVRQHMQEASQGRAPSDTCPERGPAVD